MEEYKLQQNQNSISESAPEQANAEEVFIPVDAEVKVRVEADRMTAMLQVFPPEHGGQDVTREMIEQKLQEQQVVYGIDEALIDQIVKEKNYMRMYIIAKGKPAIPGKDGIVRELFQRDQHLKLVEKEDGSIDFKNLNFLTPVEAGTVICEITAPVPPVDGENVAGLPVHGRPGKQVIIPKGEGTVLSEDGTRLLAARTGNLIFKKDRFIVEEVLHISGDIDNSVGNIDFLGEVIVDGDVREGFSIKAKGNVTVKGVVEGAVIESGGDVLMMKGVTGMNKACISAKKEIKSTFLENCTVKAGGCIRVESIINSHVVSGDQIIVNGKKAAIIGGCCMAFNSVTAKAIGSRAGIPTAIVLGATQDVINERHSLESSLKELETQLHLLDQNIAYLEILDKAGKLSPERKVLMQKIRAEKPRNQMKQSVISKRIKEINRSLENIDACRVYCQQIYPSVKVTIGNTFININSIYENCVLYYHDDKVVVSQS